MPSHAAMREFLSHRRIALVGVSRDPKQFANQLLTAMLERGFDATPITPHLTEVQGVAAYRNLQAVPGGVDGAILLLPPLALSGAVDDCLAAGVPRIWFRTSTRPGIAPDLAARAARAGARVIDGGCPFMVLEHPGWFHSAHATVARWTGSIQP